MLIHSLCITPLRPLEEGEVVKLEGGEELDLVILYCDCCERQVNDPDEMEVIDVRSPVPIQ